MADEWLNDYIEIELNKLRPKSTLDKILESGYKKVDTDLRHFELYEKGNKRILYKLSDKTIDTIYDSSKVFERFNRVIDLEMGEEK